MRYLGALGGDMKKTPLTLVCAAVSAAIWFYLMYVLLDHANVDRLVWFLFWAYFPVGFLLRLLSDRDD
jgi:hypothetical protein